MKLLSVKETAAYFRLHIMTTYRMIKRGDFITKKVGGQHKVFVEQTERRAWKAQGFEF